MPDDFPRLREDLVVRRQVMAGEVTHMVKVRETGQYFRYGEAEWAFISGLDGQTTYEQLAERFNRSFPGSEVDASQVEDLIAGLKKSGVVERTPAERSIAILEKLEDERKKRAERSQVQDVFNITFATVNPERFYKAIYPYLRWIWTPGFVVVTLAMFAAAAGVIISNWYVVREGMLRFWRFEGKTTSDIVMLFCILAVIVIIHESAHALTCINFGGEVTELGFMLMYFIPAFYANVSDAYLFDKKWPKYWTTLAGGYSELVICSLSVFTWALSEPGTFLNHLAYNVMVFAGISTIIFNYNPLIKLDGYYLLTDVLEITNLRASAIGYVMYLFKTRVLRVSMPKPSGLTPRKRRIYRIYGTLATAYVTFIVTMFVLFQYRFFNRHFPETGLFLGLFGAYMILRKRLKKFMAFSRFVYLDKKEWLTQKAAVRRWAYMVGIFAAFLLFYPFGHKVTGPVVLEPARKQPLRAETDGFIAEVADPTGRPVAAGTIVVRLRNDELVAKRQEAQAHVQEQAGQAAAALARGDIATYQAAFRGQQREEAELAELQRKESKLEVRAAFAGAILSSRLQDLVGKHVQEGEFLCDFGDLSSMRARIEVSEFDFRELAEGQPVRLQVSSFPAERFRGRVADRSQASDMYDPNGRSVSLVRTVRAAAPKAVPAATSKSKTEGIPFSHFHVTVEVANPNGKLLPGMSGMAKIQPDRHSYAMRLVRTVTELIRSRIWW